MNSEQKNMIIGTAIVVISILIGMLLADYLNLDYINIEGRNVAAIYCPGLPSNELISVVLGEHITNTTQCTDNLCLKNTINVICSYDECSTFTISGETRVYSKKYCNLIGSRIVRDRIVPE
ncbi:hypothetical protein HY570_00690 [Candidatus Micrarchaeota archaeon]|nr:hypothetical protein [Candidatus Micrarchaeota archaeon]